MCIYIYIYTLYIYIYIYNHTKRWTAALPAACAQDAPCVFFADASMSRVGSN